MGGVEDGLDAIVMDTQAVKCVVGAHSDASGHPEMAPSGVS